MVVPTQAQVASAPRDTDIVLEFNEMIDATPFLSGTQSPVTFSVRRNRAAGGGSLVLSGEWGRAGRRTLFGLVAQHAEP